jgi:hypothetical protein
MYRTEVIQSDPLVAGEGGAFKLPAGMCPTDGLIGLPPIGRDIAVKTQEYITGLNTANAKHGPTFTHFDNEASYEVNFRSIQLPSIPEYLIICAQRDVRMLSRTHSAGSAAPPNLYPHASNGKVNGFNLVENVAATNKNLDDYHTRYRSQNSAANLCIAKLELEVQNGTSSYRFKNESQLMSARDLDDLYAATRKNTVAGYCKTGTQSDWESRACCIVLHETQVFLGLCSSSVVYPVTLAVKFLAQNRARFTCGSCIASNVDASFPLVHRDIIASRPVICALFTNGILDVSEGSAVLSSSTESMATYNESVVRSAEQNQL